ncbi:MAG: hypothetical protein HQ564_09050 [Candidatus Saganbacteria bacterium]|nr:hypothetical protein [Candidatus Saganbacteria bacterium]
MKINIHSRRSLLFSHPSKDFCRISIGQIRPQAGSFLITSAARTTLNPIENILKGFETTDDLSSHFEEFVRLMRLQEKPIQNKYYSKFYAISGKMLREGYSKISIKEGITERSTKFWNILIILSRLKKIRGFFNSDTLLITNESAAYKKIEEDESNPDVVKIKELVWSLIYGEANLLNFGIEEETLPVNENEVWTSEAGRRLNQPMALIMPHKSYAQGRFYNRIYSLRKALEFAGHLPDINLKMKDQEINDEINIVFFYERLSGDLIAQLKYAARNRRANIILAPAHVKNIELRNKDGVTSGHLLWGLLYSKEGRLTLARFSAPLEIHYVYRVLKNPHARNISQLGIPIAVDYPLGQIYIKKTLVSKLFSGRQEELGIRIPKFLEFKRGSLKSMDLDSFRELLDATFPINSFKRLVIKPAVGSGGKGIEIFDRQNTRQIFKCLFSLSLNQDSMLEEGVEIAPVKIGGIDFDSTLRFHIVKDAKGKPVAHKGFCRMGQGILNVSLGTEIAEMRMEDVFRQMEGLHLTGDEIEALLLKAERSAIKIHTIMEHTTVDAAGEIKIAPQDQKPYKEIDYVVVDYFFDGKTFVLNEINIGNIGGNLAFDRLYPDRRGVLTNSICDRLIERGSDYFRNTGKIRRWYRTGTHTAGTEVEIDLTTISKNGHRRPMTKPEADSAMKSASLPDQSIYLDGFGGIESVTGHIEAYDIKGETEKFSQKSLAIILYLKRLIKHSDNDRTLISCTGQYGSGVHLNIRRASYGDGPKPKDEAIEDYHAIKRVLPIISALSTNPSEGFWHPLSRELRRRESTSYFDIKRYGDIVYNTNGSEYGIPPRLEIRPPDTPLHPAYIGIYYAIIYAALAGNPPDQLSFEDYHRAFCNGAMDNLRGATLYDGDLISLREALNRFYHSNLKIFEELELSCSQKELLDAARLNGYTYKDFNDALGRMFDEDTYLKLVVEIFERGCRNPEKKLSDIIKETGSELAAEFNISPLQLETINTLADLFIYRAAETTTAPQLPETEIIEMDNKVIIRIEKKDR